MSSHIHGKAWLERTLHENQDCLYLDNFGSPLSVDNFRQNVPLVDYNDLENYLGDTYQGKSNILFSGRPIAFESTGGSSGGSKLIPYSKNGLEDLRATLSSCLRNVLRMFDITGSIYLSTSPVTRAQQDINGVPLGLQDTEYLDPELRKYVLEHSAVPFDITKITDIDRWKEKTLSSLSQAKNLQFISVWSPTFLISLLNGIADPTKLFPDLRAISCWCSGASTSYAGLLQNLFPHTKIIAKGLMSTEAIVTYNDTDGSTVLNQNGFYEFIDNAGAVLTIEDLDQSCAYEVVITTSNGLYRYKTGDMVTYQGSNCYGNPVFDFVGRNGIISDMVGEKLNEAFVAKTLGELAIKGVLFPDKDARQYYVVTDAPISIDILQQIENALCANPQYAYAKKLGQLAELQNSVVHNFHAIVENELLRRGARLGDIKHLSLRREDFWKAAFMPERQAA